MNRLFKPFLRQTYWNGTVRGAADRLILDTKTGGAPLHVVTLTSEMALHAIQHPEVMSAIFSSDFIVADTTSLTLWLRSHKISVQRVTGVDLAEELIRRAHEPSVAVIGGGSAQIRAAAAKKIEEFGGVVSIADEGPRISSYISVNDSVLIAELNEKKPNIILVAFGHGKQEWWISKIKKELTFSTILVGVGGAIDMWGGEFTRAPRIVRAIGFEWLWRLIQEPRRFRRIIDAVIIFPYRAFLEDLL